MGLISANGVTVGRGSLVLIDAADLIESMQIAAALSFEAFAANLSVIHPAAARARPHSGLETAMSRLRELLDRQLAVAARAGRATCRIRCRSGACPRPTAPSTTPSRWRGG